MKMNRETKKTSVNKALFLGKHGNKICYFHYDANNSEVCRRENE